MGSEMKAPNVAEVFLHMIDRDFGRPIPFEMDQVRLVTVVGVMSTLMMLLSKEGPNGVWACENLLTGRGHMVDERYMSNKVYNEMEVIAWAAK